MQRKICDDYTDEEIRNGMISLGLVTDNFKLPLPLNEYIDTHFEDKVIEELCIEIEYNKIKWKTQ